MRELDKKAADRWLSDPDNLSNRFEGNLYITREEALRRHAERFKESPEVPAGPPGEAAAVPARARAEGASGDVVLKDGVEVVAEEGIEIIPRKQTELTPAEQAEVSILALQIGPAEAARMMAVSTPRADALANRPTNGLVKDAVEEVLSKARAVAANKLNDAVSGIKTDGLKPTEATQVAVGLATVVEKIENRGKKDKGVAIVWKTAGRRTAEYEEVELRVGASA